MNKFTSILLTSVSVAAMVLSAQTTAHADTTTSVGSGSVTDAGGAATDLTGIGNNFETGHASGAISISDLKIGSPLRLDRVIW